MATENAKRVGLIVADAMPPPGKLKKPFGGGDADEGEDEDMSGGRMAFEDMMAAQKRGDMGAAYDAFMEAVRACAAEKSDSKGEESGEY